MGRQIRMRRVTEIAELRHAGDFCWSDSGEAGKRWLNVLLPTPTGGTVHSSWTIAPDALHCSGGRDRPTLDGELHMVGIWRGYVRGGFLVEA